MSAFEAGQDEARRGVTAIGGVGHGDRRRAWRVALTIPLLCAALACDAPRVGRGATGGSEPPAEGPAVVIDGRFDDWEGTPERRFDDGLEPHAVAMRADGDAVYLSMRFDGESNLQGRAAPLLLVFDADADSTTGPPAFGLPGVDLVVSFTRLHEGGASDDGVAAWRPSESDPERVLSDAPALLPHDVGLWFEPRHATDRVEVRLARGTSEGEPFASGRFAARAVALDAGGAARAKTPVFRYDAAGPASRAAAGGTGAEGGVAGARDLARAPGTDLRLLVWNVAGRLTSDPAPARAILAAVAPDLVLLDEVSSGMDPATALTLLPDGPGWSVHVGTSGGRQRGIVAARGDVTRAPAFDTVSYRGEDGGPFPGGLLDPGTIAAGVPSTGAWVRIGSRRLLAVALDLTCCGNSAGSRQDRVRRLEASAIREAARRALASSDGAGTSAVIIGGDFNLVGSIDPLRLVGRGLGPDGSDLVDAYALQLDGASTATWVDAATAFPPGQLDYALYPPSRLRPLRAFVLETADLADLVLEAAGLSRDDSDRASDHRPVVVDLAWR